MRKFLILLFISFFYLSSSAQPRIDHDKPVSIEKVSLSTSAVIGWCYNDEYKKWYGYHYVISQGPTKNNKVVYPTREHMAADDEDIISMCFKRLTYKEKKYYLLYITQWDCYFDYPHIFEGRHDYKKTSVYAFTEKSYKQLWIVGDSIVKIPIRTLGSCGHVLAGYRTEKNLLLNTFDGEKQIKDIGSILYFYIKKENASVFRFRYPTNKKTIDELKPNDFFYSQAIDFSKRYFEIRAEDFYKLRID